MNPVLHCSSLQKILGFDENSSIGLPDEVLRVKVLAMQLRNEGNQVRKFEGRRLRLNSQVENQLNDTGQPDCLWKDLDGVIAGVAVERTRAGEALKVLTSRLL